jgi:thiamine-phosphate pyrophosphorylase
MNKKILCYVTDRKAFGLMAGADASRVLIERIGQAMRAGVDWIQLREKDLEGRTLFTLASQAMALSAETARAAGQKTRILINDRLDVAWASHAGGVHLGEDSLPAGEVTHWRKQAGGSDFLVGVSCHSLEAAMQAAAAGADYIVFGPVFATPSKQAFGAPQGLHELERICRAVSVPVLAIGGITIENARDCFETGAAGIAAIRLFQRAPERIAAAIAHIRR